MNTEKSKYKYIGLLAGLLLLVLVACGNKKGAEEGPSITVTIDPSQSTTEDIPLITEIREEESKHPEYNISLQVNFAEKQVTGIERIKYVNTSNRALETIELQVPLKAFEKNSPEIPYFHPFEEKIFNEQEKKYGKMDFGEVTINGETTPYYFSGSMMTVELRAPLEPMAKVEIVLPFYAEIAAINHRTGANDKAMWLGNFFPTLAVNQKGNWSNYPYYPAGDPFFTEISNYTVKITSPLDLNVIGTGDEKETQRSEHEKTTTYQARLVRDFSLVLGTDYEDERLETKDGIEVYLYHYSFMETSQKEKILATMVETIEYLNEYIGVYPYKRYYIVETGHFNRSGMEHAQLSFLDTERLLDPDLEETLVHEISHQWFYNIVGNNQIEASWLDEGFALYFQKKLTLSPEAFDLFIIENYEKLNSRLLEIENYKLTDSIDVYTNWSDYYTVQHLRAMFMIYNLEQYMGPEKFELFIKNYYIEFAFKIATKDTFIDLVEGSLNRPMDLFFEGWMEDRVLPKLVKTGTDLMMDE